MRPSQFCAISIAPLPIAHNIRPLPRRPHSNSNHSSADSPSCLRFLIALPLIQAGSLSAFSHALYEPTPKMPSADSSSKGKRTDEALYEKCLEEVKQKPNKDVSEVPSAHHWTRLICYRALEKVKWLPGRARKPRNSMKNEGAAMRTSPGPRMSLLKESQTPRVAQRYISSRAPRFQFLIDVQKDKETNGAGSKSPEKKTEVR